MDRWQQENKDTENFKIIGNLTHPLKKKTYPKHKSIIIKETKLHAEFFKSKMGLGVETGARSGKR